MKESKKTQKSVNLDKYKGSYKWKDVKLILLGKEISFTPLIYKSKK